MAAAKVAALCVAGALMASALRVTRPEMALVTALATGLCALFFCMDSMSGAVSAALALAEGAGLNEVSSQLMLRATGVALITDFAAQLCRDAGEGALSGRVELAGRITLGSMAAPLLLRVTDELTELLP